MTIFRLLNYPVTLVERVDTGVEDSWGAPIIDEMRTETHGYYRQVSGDDYDSGASETVEENGEVFVGPDIRVAAYSAVEIDYGDGVVVYEVLGPPARELNARTGRVSHLKIRVRRAEM